MLVLLLLLVWIVQTIPSLGQLYADKVYPLLSYLLSGFSQQIPFAIGDLFIFLSLMWLIIYPFLGHYRYGMKGKRIFLYELEFLAWIYVWFYLAWGLNYSQPDFYARTRIPYIPFEEEEFQRFATDYVKQLNASYTPINCIQEQTVRDEVVKQYKALNPSLGIHQPPHDQPQVKRMLFTPLISMVGVSGSMGPFFCEFTLNGDLPPSQYISTYAHELSHLLGITSEAEANFYAYQVCTHSSMQAVKFSGYFFLLPHILSNAKHLLNEEETLALYESIRPEVRSLYQENHTYWAGKYSPVIGSIQDWMYDLYLKGNKIENGQKNYSEVIGLLISYEQYQQKERNAYKTRTSSSVRPFSGHTGRIAREVSVGQKTNQCQLETQHH